MDFQDRIAEWFWSTLDRVLDSVTGGGWSAWQGQRVVKVLIKSMYATISEAEDE